MKSRKNEEALNWLGWDLGHLIDDYKGDWDDEEDPELKKMYEMIDEIEELEGGKIDIYGIGYGQVLYNVVK